MSNNQKLGVDLNFRESVILPLNFQLQKDDYAAFECDVTYFVAENGEKKSE